MATKCMPWMVLAAVMAISLVAGSASAEDHAFNFNDEVKKGEELTLLDFAQPPFNPDQMEWVK